MILVAVIVQVTPAYINAVAKKIFRFEKSSKFDFLK